MIGRHVTEQGNLVADAFVERHLRAADNDVRLNSHSLQLFDARLCRLGFEFLGCLEIRNQCDVNQNCIFVSDIQLELADGLQKRLALDVTDRAAHFDDGNLCILTTVIAIKTAF